MNFWKLKPRCALCLKRNELQESHIYPRHVYKAIRMLSKNKQAKYVLSPRADEEVKQIEEPNFDGVKEKLLCKTCEQHLNLNYERYFAEVFISFPTPPIHYNITSTRQVVRDGTVFKEMNNLDYTKVKLYVISVFWRASVSKAFGKRIRVSFWKKNKMRKMILNVDPRNETDFPVNIHQPSTIKEKDNEIIVPFDVFPLFNDPSLYYTIISSYLIYIRLDKKGNLPDTIKKGFDFCQINKSGRILIELLKPDWWFAVLYGMTGIGGVMERNHDTFQKNGKPSPKKP